MYGPHDDFDDEEIEVPWVLDPYPIARVVVKMQRACRSASKARGELFPYDHGYEMEMKYRAQYRYTRDLLGKDDVPLDTACMGDQQSLFVSGRHPVQRK